MSWIEDKVNFDHFRLEVYSDSMRETIALEMPILK